MTLSFFPEINRDSEDLPRRERKDLRQRGGNTAGRPQTLLGEGVPQCVHARYRERSRVRHRNTI